MLRFELDNGGTPVEIVERLKRGDRAAQEWVYRSFSRMVFTMARRMLGDVGLAEDATQDTFVDVLCKAGSLDRDDALAAWIRRIAVNHCLMRLRSPWTKWRTNLLYQMSSWRVRTRHSSKLPPISSARSIACLRRRGR